MKISVLSVATIAALGRHATAQVAKSAKTSSSSKSGKLSLQEQVDALKKEVSDLEKLINAHPVDPTCTDNEARIADLAQGLPTGCTLAASPTLGNDYRLVCTEPGVIQIHLPDMCNATAVLVGGGGSGGNSPEVTGLPVNQFSGGGGAGGVVTRKEAAIGDGYYVISVGRGGVTDTRTRNGNGGDTSFRLTMRQSLTDASYAGEEIVAFGGGRGGGVNGEPIHPKLPCSFPTDGGSGGGGTPGAEGECNYNVNQDGGITIGINQGHAGGNGGITYCPGGGGGAGGPGTDGNLVSNNCLGGTGGDGIYLGDLVGTDYGVPGGWFAGGGAGSSSDMGTPGSKGGGGYYGGADNSGYRGNKVGKANTGGGGMGCSGGQFYGATCMFDASGNTETWGADGGSGILFIVFDKCPCNQ